MTKFLTSCALCAVFLTGMMKVAGASSTMYAIDPNAHALLNKMQAAYSGLNSLSEKVVAEESPSVPNNLTLQTQILVLRPDYLLATSDSKSARTGSTEVVTDGSRCYVTAPQYPSRFLEFAVPPSSTALTEALSEHITSSFTLAAFSDSNFIPSLFADSRLATLQTEKPVKVDGVLTDVVVSTDRSNVTLTLFIDRSDHLLRRVIAIDPNKGGDFTETYTQIQGNAPLKPTQFAFTRPPHTLPYYARSFDQIQQNGPVQ